MKVYIAIAIIGFIAVATFVGIGIVGSGIATYNTLVTLQETSKKQWANVENQYERRSDLIPNLVEVVKGYASHERGTLKEVIEARAKATQTKVDINDVGSIAKFQAAQGELSSALARLMVVVEKYPELRAIEEFKKLHDDLAGTENRIAYERQKYNKDATDFNIARRRPFAIVVILIIGNFNELPLFQATEGKKGVPTVKF